MATEYEQAFNEAQDENAGGAEAQALAKARAEREAQEAGEYGGAWKEGEEPAEKQS